MISLQLNLTEIHEKLKLTAISLTAVSMVSGCASTGEPATANTESYAVDQLFATGDINVDTNIPAIAIRYPASIRIESDSGEAEIYERIVQLTDANLTNGAFFISPGDVKEEADLGTFFLRSTLMKSRLAAHAIQANIKSEKPAQLIFTQAMDLVIHPASSDIGECHSKRGDDEGAASFCLEVKPAASEPPTPVDVVVDVAVFNDYNLTTYGLNSYRSLGHEISPLVSVGRFDFDNGEYGGRHFTYFAGVKGSLPDDTSLSAFTCLLKKCKKKSESKSKAFRQKPIAFAEDTVFASLAPMASAALKAIEKDEQGSYAALLGKSLVGVDIGNVGIPALMDGVSTTQAISFLKMEGQFQDERSQQTAALFQNNLYQPVLSSLDSEEVFSQKVRKANKSKRTESVLGIIGAAAAATASLSAAGAGDAVVAQEMLGNMNLFTSYLELSVIEADSAVIDFSDQARDIEDQIGRINLDNQGFEEGVERSAGTISELRDIQRELLSLEKG